MRIGIGYDLHRLIPTVERSAIPVGGIPISCFLKVEAHSDGDVLLHSIVDAILGSLALGDIGQWFPDNAEVNRGRPSSEFLVEVVSHIKKMGWRVNQLDTVMFLEEPKLAEHWTSIRENLAKLLGVEMSNVSVKAKTMEGMGPVGERKAIAAQAAVTIQRIN